MLADKYNNASAILTMKTFNDMSKASSELEIKLLLITKKLSDNIFSSVR